MQCPNPSTTVVITDTSGSMREHGKAMLARNIIAYVREQRRLGDGPPLSGEAIVVLWGDETSIVALLPEQDVPPFRTGGRARMEPLLMALERLRSADGSLRIFLLSDGHIARADVEAFRGWQRRHSGVSVRALAIGPDAVLATLEKMADPGGVFLPAEVVAAITTWDLPREPTLPARLAEVTRGAVEGKGPSRGEGVDE